MRSCCQENAVALALAVAFSQNGVNAAHSERIIDGYVKGDEYGQACSRCVPIANALPRIRERIEAEAIIDDVFDPLSRLAAEFLEKRETE